MLTTDLPVTAKMLSITQNVSHQSSACILSTTPSKGLSQKGVLRSSHRRDTQCL